MEQDGITTGPITNSSKQKDNKKWKIAIVAVSVVAACGIGFGIYGMMQSSQKDNQISDLKVQIKDGEKTVAVVETPEIENSTEVSGGPFIENGYFYVPKWGGKI